MIKFLLVIVLSVFLSSCIMFKQVNVAQVENNPCFYSVALGEMGNIEGTGEIIVSSNSIAAPFSNARNEWKDENSNFQISSPSTLNSCVKYRGLPLEPLRIYRVNMSVHYFHGTSAFCIERETNDKTSFLISDGESCSIVKYNEDGTIPYWYEHRVALVFCSLIVLLVYLFYWIKARRKKVSMG